MATVHVLRGQDRMFGFTLDEQGGTCRSDMALGPALRP